jgi:hypothetical protein
MILQTCAHILSTANRLVDSSDDRPLTKAHGHTKLAQFINHDLSS